MDRHKEFSDEKVAAFIRRYHALVRADPLLGPLFCDCVEDWDAHSARLAAYWSKALRHEPTPEFPSLTPVRLGCSGPKLQRWQDLWDQAADEAFSGDAAAELHQQGEEMVEEHFVGALADD